MALTKTDLQSIDGLLIRRLQEEREQIQADVADVIERQNEYLEEKFEDVDKRLDRVHDRVDRVGRSVGNHENRLRKLEKVHPHASTSL